MDGDPDSCSFTPRSPEQRWWQVHLGDAVTIQAVAVTISPGAYQQFTIFVIGEFPGLINFPLSQITTLAVFRLKWLNLGWSGVVIG